MNTATLPAEDAIRGAGLRLTEPRRAVYEALRAHPHATADDLLSPVLTSVPGTSLQSVYNALSDFTDAGLVRRIEPAGHPGMFELRVRDNHHHLICSECGRVVDVDCAVGAAPCLTPSDDHGFVIREAEVTFWGTCAPCAASAPDTSVAPVAPTATPPTLIQPALTRVGNQQP